MTPCLEWSQGTTWALVSVEQCVKTTAGKVSLIAAAVFLARFSLVLIIAHVLGRLGCYLSAKHDCI